jgi:parallel beta-helix repeat protein
VSPVPSRTGPESTVTGSITLGASSSILNGLTVSDGVLVSSSDSVTVKYDIVGGGGKAGIDLEGSTLASVHDNAVQGVSQYGVLVAGSDGATVVDNSITETVAAGVGVRASKNASVRRNVIEDPGQFGVTVDGASAGAVVRNNSVSTPLFGLSGAVLDQAAGTGLADVTVTLDGVDYTGASVSASVTTPADGSYQFDVLPGAYSLTESSLPAGYVDGQNDVGSLGGSPSHNEFTGIVVNFGSTGTGYNFQNLFGNVLDVTAGTAYATIQAAVNGARAGDTIRVMPGTYNEVVTIGTPGITLDGADFGVSPVTGARGPESILTGPITVNAPGVTIDGFTVSVNSQWAIEVGSGGAPTGPWSGCVIQNNIVNSSIYGIQIGDEGGPSTPLVALYATVKSNVLQCGNSDIVLFNCSNNSVVGNSIKGGGYSGIDIYYSNDNVIDSNNVVNCGLCAIRLRGSHGNLVENNSGSGNGQPDIQQGEGSDGNTFVNNTLTGP